MKTDLQKIIDDLKIDGDNLVKNFEEKLEQYKQQLVTELGEASS